MVLWVHPIHQPDLFTGFCTAHHRVTIYFAIYFPLKIDFSGWESGPPFNTRFFGPAIVLNPNAISIGSAVFAGLTTVTDRQTDRQTTLLDL